VPEGFGADDGVGMVWRDRRLERAVSSRPQGRCVRVRRLGDGAVEEPLPVEVLAGSDHRHTPDDVREFRTATRRRAALGR
jgi:hypothetical protein